AQLIDGERDTAFAHESRPAAPRTDEIGDRRDESFARAGRGAARGPQPTAVLLEHAAHHLGEQAALVREVVVERRLRDRRVARDVLERDAPDAALAPEAVRGLEQPLAGRAPGAPPAGRAIGPLGGHPREFTYR